jgi:predicted O-methyltransferase YrrM
MGKQRYSVFPHFFETLKPRTIMEIGVFNANNAEFMLLAALNHHPRVDYFGFDLFKDGKDRPTFKEVHKRLNSIEGAVVALFKGDSRKTVPATIPSLPKMDAIFIDGGHSLGVVDEDWKNCQRLMHKDTVVFFDDYWDTDKTGARPLINRLMKDPLYEVALWPVSDRSSDDKYQINIATLKVRS